MRTARADMGISISKAPRCGKDLSPIASEQMQPICGTNTVRTPESQRNDNATKLMEQRRMRLFSPTQISTSSSSLTSLTQWPKLGGSPLADSTEASDRDSPFKSEQCWQDGVYGKVSCDARSKTTPLTRPPWRPSAASANWKCWECHGGAGIDSNHQLPRLVNMAGNAARYKYGRRKTMSLQSVSCIGDVRLQTGEAHLRRCSAAQQVQAMRPDVLDTMSLNGQWRPTVRRVERGAVRKDTHSQPAPSTMNCKKEFGLKSIMEDKDDTNATDKALSLTIGAERKTDHCKSPHHESQYDNVYPLQYVFYVEDTPDNVRALASGGKMAILAHDLHCRIYFHAQRNGLIRMGQTDGLRLEEERVLEPALYYKGKRVRPVTVVSRNMTELRLFLQTLDAHYPDFEASAFLTDQLVHFTPSGSATSRRV
ncbi:unnamed protein product [Dicrocoelium dendriticum]|nr:unnamed protein product [Dicrocoelium dendriticum]